MEFRERAAAPQESQARKFEDVPEADVIVVLGCELKRNKAGEIVPGMESKMRALGALELLKEGKAKRIMFTGGVAKEFPGKSIAEAMKEYVMKYGVPEENILLETESKNTAENIKNTLDILAMEKEKAQSISLLTNEYHLGRAKQLLGNFLEKRDWKLKIGVIAVEDLLKQRSRHYDKIAAHYQFPTSLVGAPSKKLLGGNTLSGGAFTPEKALIKGLREALRRVIIHVDPNDKTVTFLAQKIR